MQPIAVRRAVLGDVDALSALFIALDEHHFRGNAEEFFRLDSPARTREAIEQIVVREDGVLLAAIEMDTGTIVGLVHVYKRDFPQTIVTPSRCVAEIDSLVVACAFRQSGVGTKLILAAEQWATHRGLTVVELGVREFNSSALAFYEAVGFQTTSRRMRKKV